MKSERDLGKQRSRRQHDRAFKEELVRQSLEPGASVSAISLRNGINANMLFKWRREHLRDLRAAGQSATPTVLLGGEAGEGGAGEEHRFAPLTGLQATVGRH